MSRFDLFNKTASGFVATDARPSPAFLPTPLPLNTMNPVTEFTDVPGNWPLIPWPRGPLSAAVIDALARAPGTLGAMPAIEVNDALTDDDLHLALYLCYEVHYRELTANDWEWDTDLLNFRARLEEAFAARLTQEVSLHHLRNPFDVTTALDHLLVAASPSAMANHFLSHGTLDQMRELCVHQSASQLREGDPRAFAISRLSGVAKAALIEVQFDDAARIAGGTRASMFATTMEALGLDPSYGSYIEMLPGVTLAGVNLVSMFALHRKWLGALIGHVAIHEVAAVEPMRHYDLALERFGVDATARRFYGGHSENDPHDISGARSRMVSGLLGTEPEMGAQILFGAAAMLLLEEHFTHHVLGAWEGGRSSLAPWEMNSTM